MLVDLTTRTELRQTLRQRRHALSNEQQKQAAIALASDLPEHSLVQHASHIAIYLANDGEIDPSLLAEILIARGKKLALPVLHPFSQHHLLFVEYQLGQPMQANRFGIKEPALEMKRIIPLAELDLILLPLVGFDLQGNRLGMGGGFYDRTLAELSMAARPKLIGLAHECQRVEQLPTEPWDVRMDAIATEQGLQFLQ